MLTCLKHNYQVRKVVRFSTACEDLNMILFIILVAEFLQDIKNDLGVNSSHSKSLKETSHTLFNVTISIILALEILTEAHFCPVILPTDNFRNLIETDSARV